MIFIAIPNSSFMDGIVDAKLAPGELAQLLADTLERRRDAFFAMGLPALGIRIGS